MPPVAAPPRQPRRPGPAQPGPAPAGGQFEQLHPRGRGGQWIAKPGDGTGAAGPDTTTAQLQQRLRQLGFKVPVNGQYDAATAAAVASFQTRYGLDPHGGVDAATMSLLQTPPPQTLAQVQKTKGLTAKGNPKSTSSAKRKKTTTTTRKVKGGSQKAGGKAAGTITAKSLGTGALAQGQGMTGSSNKNVSSLQTALTQAGYKTTSDGRFGPQTEAAVKKLQADHGLTADGVVGPETKGLLIGLDSAKSIAAKKATRRVKAAAKRVPGQPATLRTAAPHARHGSRTAGSRMQLKPPAKAPTTLKYHAEHEEAPVLRIKRLEEGTWIGGNGTDTSTVAFGTGGQPSLSIKDGRDTVPACDQPIWTRTGVLISPPNTTIQDGRAPTAPAPRNLTIQDGRDYDSTVALLAEAVEARKTATTGDEFTRARAREILLRERLREGFFSEMLHPRGRGGKWVDKTGKAVKPGASTAATHYAKIKAGAAARAEKEGSVVTSVRTGIPPSLSPHAPKPKPPKAAPSPKQIASQWQSSSAPGQNAAGGKLDDLVNTQMSPASKGLTVHSAKTAGIKDGGTLDRPTTFSSNEKVAGMFGGPKKDVVHLDVPEGHPTWEPGKVTGMFPNEKEVVLPKGSRIHIDRTEVKGGVTHHYGHVSGEAGSAEPRRIRAPLEPRSSAEVTGSYEGFGSRPNRKIRG